MRKNFDHGQVVYVYYKGAGYEGEYKGVDTFDDSTPHRVQIHSMHRELSFSDEDVFSTLSQLRDKYPQIQMDI